MYRSLLLFGTLLLALSALTLAGCDGFPPNPGVAAEIRTLVVTPEAPVVGDTVTVVVDLATPRQIDSLEFDWSYSDQLFHEVSRSEAELKLMAFNSGTGFLGVDVRRRPYYDFRGPVSASLRVEVSE